MIVVTGASGHLGRLVIEELKKRVPAERIVAAARTPEKAADLGVEVREADYDRPETLKDALRGATKVLLISGVDVNRAQQHAAIVDAAKEAGAALAYTSAPSADITETALAADHKATEAYIKASGVAYTIVRNNWYHENYAQSITMAPQLGALYGAAGDGRIASASRADYAAGAAAVLAGDGHEGKVYELTGDTAWTLAELAAEISAVTGKEIAYQNLSKDDYAGVLAGAGVPAPMAGVLADVDVNISRGWLAHTPGTLRELIGRPTQPIGEYVRAVLA
ncbi:NAD(P)H dehydrogenase (quinone) [Nonomuraea polychroma]|uniref:NAD(P)H dehydrogenase (Quinone) n=1 Tax=Nonomuraea polychroma TaxID=46176 RepID=A0A438M2L0_9ACTN|nr:SDR family oxidoreductase [Nonomuraea polychroma]RVX40025.1 NAD(P)H dehydrogenase (quinone) [Nonomuraea polychroma]